VRHYSKSGKERLKQRVIRRLPENSVGDHADVTWRGGSFQTRGTAAIGKARSPTVGSRVRRTISDDDDAEGRLPRASTSEDRRNSATYGDAVPCKQLNVRTNKYSNVHFYGSSFQRWTKLALTVLTYVS